MSYFEENQYEIFQEAQFQQQLRDEPMYNVDKYLIMNETQTFNYAKLSNENSRKIIVKLIYLINQGIKFSEQEVEQLFFRITKLFSSNNASLRDLAYKSLKLIMPQKYVHVLIQSLIKDLISDNLKIKLEALRFIPFIQDEQYIQQIGRFVHNALLDKNLLIQSTALISGIHIINKFPNFIVKWQYELLQILEEPLESLEYHALILSHEIKKHDLAQFIQTIIQLMKKPLKPLIQQQLIKFTYELYKILDIQYKKRIVAYLFSQMNNLDPLVFFQSAIILIKIQEIQNIELQPIISRLKTILSINDFQLYLQKFIALNLIEKLFRIPRRQKLIQGEILMYIKTYSYSCFASISSKSLQVCIHLHGKRAVNSLQKLYNSKVVQQGKYNFLNGLLELIISHPIYEPLVLKFIEITDIQFSNNKFIIIVLKLLEQINMNSINNIQIALDAIFQIMETKLKLKQSSQFLVIKLICRLYFNIEIKQLDLSQTSHIYQFLRNYFLNERKYLQITLEQFEFYRKEILKIQNCNIKVQQGQISSDGIMNYLKLQSQNLVKDQVSNYEKNKIFRYIQMQDVVLLQND